MELIILECLAAFFLFLSIVRPLVRGFWALPGLTVCPLLALGIIIGIFPAYGFRPECIPLLLFAIFLFLANFWDFLALFSSLQSDSYRDTGLLFTLCSATVFAFTLWMTFHFAPPMDLDLSTEGITTVFLQRDELHLRIYGPVTPVPEIAEPVESEESAELVESVEPVIIYETPRPLLVLLPPVAGSFPVTDRVCVALRDRGFTVLTYSRKQFDSPYISSNGAPVRLNFYGLLHLSNALSRGLRNTKANAQGRELEECRKEDTLLLLRELAENRTLQNLLGNIDKNNIFLAGYGAGGAALTVLAGDDRFSSSYPQIRGIITIEAPLLSSLEGDPLPPPPPPAYNPISDLFQQIGEFIKSISPKKITHITETPKPNLPVLYLLSDRVINERTGRYETILRTVSGSKKSALIAAIRGAGPFDYSDSPLHYPLFSVLFRGAEHTETNRNWPELTASLITNFAVMILENTVDDSIPPEIPLVKTALDNSVYLERGGVWQIPDVQSILQP